METPSPRRTDIVTRRDWWLGIGLLVVAVLAHAVWPRYEWSPRAGVAMIRIDRWTGRTALVTPSARLPTGTYGPDDVAPER